MYAVQEGGQLLQARLQQKLQAVNMEDAVLMTRMCGHYLNLTAIAETLHMCAPTLRHASAARSVCCRSAAQSVVDAGACWELPARARAERGCASSCATGAHVLAGVAIAWGMSAQGAMREGDRL